MPQLDPNPWFMILACSWTIFVLILIPKTLGHSFPTEPSPKGSPTIKPEPWTWQ